MDKQFFLGDLLENRVKETRWGIFQHVCVVRLVNQEKMLMMLGKEGVIEGTVSLSQGEELKSTTHVKNLDQECSYIIHFKRSWLSKWIK